MWGRAAEEEAGLRHHLVLLVLYCVWRWLRCYKCYLIMGTRYHDVPRQAIRPYIVHSTCLTKQSRQPADRHSRGWLRGPGTCWVQFDTWLWYVIVLPLICAMHSLDTASAAKLETHFGCSVRLLILLTGVGRQFLGPFKLQLFRFSRCLFFAFRRRPAERFLDGLEDPHLIP